MNDQPLSSEVSSDDRLWTLLAYIFSPLVPIILLLIEDKKNRPFIRAHNAQALVMGIVNFILAVVVAWFTFGCLNLIIWILMVYWGIKAYQGNYVKIPVVTDLCKNQGWA